VSLSPAWGEGWDEDIGGTKGDPPPTGTASSNGENTGWGGLVVVIVGGGGARWFLGDCEGGEGKAALTAAESWATWAERFASVTSVLAIRADMARYIGDDSQSASPPSPLVAGAWGLTSPIAIVRGLGVIDWRLRETERGHGHQSASEWLCYGHW
jgi:hypothetical protein